MRLAPFAAALLALSCDACAGSNDVLIASGQSVGFGGVVSGGVAENLDWIHRNSAQELIGLGVTHEELADTRLDLARLTGAVGSDNSLQGIAEAGPVVEGTTHYTLVRMTVDGSRSVSPTLRIVGGSQYVKADRVRNLLLRAGGIWLPVASLSVRSEIGRSIGGNLPTRFASVRGDFVRRVQLYAGASFGKSAQSVVELGDVKYRRFVDGFVGIAIPVSGCTIGLSWDRLGLESLVRRTVTFSVSMPIGETA
jgi:hypothetical protein